MGIFNGCLLACDVDGTLLKNGVIPKRNILAINRFIKEGGFFSIVTGRAVGALNMILRNIEDIAPCVVFNGSMIYDYKNNAILDEVTLSNDDYFIVEEVAKNHVDIGIEIHSGDKVFTFVETSETIDHQIYEELKAEKVDFETLKKLNWNKAIFMLDNESQLEILKKFVSNFEHKCDLVETSAFIENRKRIYFEMIPIGVNKAKGIEKLAEILNVNKGCVYAIGDYYNDLEMIKKADIGAVVADSPQEIKNCADFVAGECENGAVADFIEYLFTKRKDANDGFSN